jgi:hypothetical protein
MPENPNRESLFLVQPQPLPPPQGACARCMRGCCVRVCCVGACTCVWSQQSVLVVWFQGFLSEADSRGYRQLHIFLGTGGELGIGKVCILCSLLVVGDNISVQHCTYSSRGENNKRSWIIRTCSH